MSDGIRDAEGRRPDWLSLSSGMGESKVINGLRADLERAECKIDSLTKRLIDADQDVARLRAELAAERERAEIAEKERQWWKDAHAVVVNARSRTEKGLLAERESKAALAAEIDDARSEVRNALSFLRHAWSLVMGYTPGPPPFDVALGDIEERLSSERAEKAALAAALELARELFDELLCASQAQEFKSRLADPSAILAAVKADQRRKGAAWALRRIISQFATEHDRPWFEKMLAAIERGEVEVGE